ncbi:MAG TPA: V-type ATPase 116kDa subunit family protein [Gallionellaceae bacterium]
MFTPLPMQRVTLSLLKDDAPQAALVLAMHGAFNPEISEATPEQLPELPGQAYRRTHGEGQAQLDKIFIHYEMALPQEVSAPGKPVLLEELESTTAWLRQEWAQCSEQQERMRILRQDFRHATQLYKTLEQFMSLNIDLTKLQKESRVMNLRVGMVPRANIQRFEEAIGLAGHVAIRFFTGLEQVHLIVAGPTGLAGDVERVFQSAGWRATEVPAEFHGRPAEVRASLAAELERLNAQLAQEDAQRLAAPARDNLRERLHNAAHILACAAPYAELSTLMRARGNLATVSGWMPTERIPGLQHMLDQTFFGRYALHARDPRPDERMLVPSLISHHRWLRPFASLVLNYGVPRYGEIDPTILFAVTFVLMFGMMFGDAGQGAVIALAGILLRRRLGQYSALAFSAGASSAFFGLLYGSVFGFEEVLHPLWMSPLSDPLRMLGIALGWGVAFIVLATVLTIRNRIAEGRIKEALFDAHGAAGLALYLGVIVEAFRYGTQGRPDMPAALLVIAALGALMAQTWQHNRTAPVWERALIALMEAFEAVMSYVSNTLSFLRLAAFSLNHVALTIAIFTVGSMLHATGYWASVVLGNIFILVLEGGIVAIQTLRLEYYEGFSRFFGGDGRAFQPLRLGGGKGLGIKVQGVEK